MKTLVVTGHSSEIASQLFGLIEKKQIPMKVLRCGRDAKSDHRVDFGDPKQTIAFTEWLQQNPPDFMFLNHGMLPGKRAADLSVDLMHESFHVNLSSFALVLEALPKLERTRTVVMSSISGKAGSYDTLYAAFKAGVDVLVRGIASQLPPNARLNAVSPGIIEDARMTTVRRDYEVLEAKKKRTPTKRFTTSIDVANLVYYVLFEAENLLGENINLNGGLHIP